MILNYKMQKKINAYILSKASYNYVSLKLPVVYRDTDPSMDVEEFN
jgi:hypothetical protein